MTFVEPVLPLPRLIIAGAGHVGKAVARLGRLLDFSVTVIDDRPEFADVKNVPDADEIVAGDIGEAVRAVEDSPDNYFVIVTRGHQKDAEALRAALGRGAAYVGMIGSKRKIELMHCEFLESGWATGAEWDADPRADRHRDRVEDGRGDRRQHRRRARAGQGRAKGDGPAMIWAVVLAAGESRRMGTQKLLLPFGDTTVVAAVVRSARASRAGRTLVVLGADRAAVRLELEPRGVEFAVNEDYQLGMLSSVQAGFRALPADAAAAVVMLGDQPFLPSRVIDAVIGAYEEHGRGIVIPAFQGRRGHPVLIDLKYRGEVLALDPADGLRRLMRAHPGDILEVEAGDANILRDLDTPEDYAALPKPS